MRVKKAQEQFPPGTPIKSIGSGWDGIVQKINKKNPSSPIVVRWDRNGSVSNENCMTIRKWTTDETSVHISMMATLANMEDQKKRPWAYKEGYVDPNQSYRVPSEKNRMKSPPY